MAGVLKMPKNNVFWKGPEKQNKHDEVATTAKHPDSCSQISCYSCVMQSKYGTCAVSHFRVKLLLAAVSEPAIVIYLKSLMRPNDGCKGD